MADIFISYSRKDIAYAKILHAALKEHDLETWIDWQDIPPTVEWLDEVYSAIEQANTFIFILSATSALSKICSLEIEHARKNNKRIIPIVINDVEPSKVHPALAAINWIFSRSKDELQPAIESLIEAIQTDYDWVKAHTRLQMRALEWERADQDKSFLLQGTDLHQAENWLVEAPEKEPEPTLMQTRYIQSSRQEAAKRQRRLLLGVGAALIVTVVLGMFAVINGQRATQSAFGLATQVVVAEEAEAEAVEQKNIAEENARLAHIRELTAVSQQSGVRFDIAMLLGVESFNAIENYQTKSNLFRLYQLNPKVTRIVNYEYVRRISFSPDGKYLAYGADDGNIILWNTTNGQPTDITFSSEDNDGVGALSFSPDGKILASGYLDGTIILWDVASGQPYENTGKQPNMGVVSISFSPDGKLIASGSYADEGDGTIILWDVASMQPVSEPLQGFYSVGASGGNIAFSPGGKILAYTSGSNPESSITFWDVVNGEPIGEPLPGWGNFIHALSFSPDGNILAAVGEGQWIKLWDVTSRQPIIETYQGHTAGVLSISFSPDGSTFATSSRDRTIILWDTATLQPIGEPLFVHDGEIPGIAFSPDGNTLASCSLDGTIILWDMAGDDSKVENLAWFGDWGTNNAAFSPDRKTMAIGHGNGTILLWDVANRQTVGDPLKGHEGELTSIAFSPDGKTLASASLNGTIILWDAASRQPLGDPMTAGETKRSLVVAFSPDGAILASACHGEDKPIVLWDTTSGQPIDNLSQENKRYINALAFSPDGKILAIGFESGNPMLWDMINRKPLAELLGGQTGWVDSLAFSPDGAIMASGSDDATIALFDVASMQPLGSPLRVHNSTPWSIAFSLDGSLLASASQDGMVVLWDVASGQPLGDPLTAAETEYNAHIIAFSPDGKSLIALSQDGSLYSWDINTELWRNQLCERVGRNFTLEEWETYFPDEPYRITCEHWPSVE